MFAYPQVSPASGAWAGWRMLEASCNAATGEAANTIGLLPGNREGKVCQPDASPEARF